MSNLRKETDEDVIDLVELLRVLLHKAHIIILSTLAFGLIACLGSYLLITPQYAASITLYVNNFANREATATITQSDLNTSIQLVNTYSVIISSDTVLEEVIDRADVDLTVEDLREKLSTSAVNDTEVFTVTVLDEDPKAAARVANTIAEVAPGQIAQIVEGGSTEVVDYAKIPTEKAKPSYQKLTLIGMALGFILSVLLIFLREMTDSSIRAEADFEQWEYPLLCTIPDLNEAVKRQTKGYGYGGYGRQPKKKGAEK